MNKIVISRTDSIGDVVLTLPMAGWIKKNNPNVQVVFLGNTYTKPIISCCKYVDEIWDWSDLSNQSEQRQAKWLKAQEIDAFIHVFPNKLIARLVKKAGIKHRIGTSHRAFHWLNCNHRPNFTRKNSQLHEAQLNFKLLAPLGFKEAIDLETLSKLSGFTKLPELPSQFSSLLTSEKKNIILHCKSQGSAVEWGVEKFIELSKSLESESYNLFFTGTESEAEFFRSDLPDQSNIYDLSGKMTLDELIAFISKADALIAASTGPLHIAGVTNIHTIGLFSTVRPIHAGRWQPLGQYVSILKDEKSKDFTQPLQIDLRDVKKAIKFLDKK